ncbi:MAG: hypothetical protein ACTTHG_06455 [Treponemataceae bacterium]
MKNRFFIFVLLVFLLLSKAFSESEHIQDSTKFNENSSKKSGTSKISKQTQKKESNPHKTENSVRYDFNEKNHTIGINIKTKVQKNNSIESIFFTKIHPDPSLVNWAIKQNTENFVFQTGNLSFSGSNSKMNNLSWTSIDCFSENFLSSIFFKANNPINANSVNNFSTFIKYTPPLQNFLQFKPNFCFAWTPDFNATTKIDTSKIFVSSIFPFNFGKYKFSLGISYASSYLEKNSSSWYLKSPYFLENRFSKFLGEIDFKGNFFKIYSAFFLSQDPVKPEIFKSGERFDAMLDFNFSKYVKNTTATRVFLSQNDLYTLNGKIIKEPLHYCISEKIQIKLDLCNIIFSSLFDSKYSYDEGASMVAGNSECFQCGIKADFFTWNLCTKYKYRIDTTKFFFTPFHEILVSCWITILKYNDFFISNFSYLQFTSENWNIYTKLNFSQKKLNFEISEKLGGKYENEDSASLKKINTDTKIKISCKNFWLSTQINTKPTKKAISNTEKKVLNTAFKISIGYSIKF